MTQDPQQDHVDRTWGYLDSSPFEPLLRLTHGLYEAGPDALEAVLRILSGEWRFSQFPLQGVACDKVLELAQTLHTTVAADFPWTLEGLEQAVAEGRLPQPGSDPVASTVLCAMVMRAPSRLDLLAVMQVLGRQECLERLQNGASCYRAMNLVG